MRQVKLRRIKKVLKWPIIPFKLVEDFITKANELDRNEFINELVTTPHDSNRDKAIVVRRLNNILNIFSSQVECNIHKKQAAAQTKKA